MGGVANITYCWIVGNEGMRYPISLIYIYIYPLRGTSFPHSLLTNRKISLTRGGYLQEAQFVFIPPVSSSRVWELRTRKGEQRTSGDHIYIYIYKT